MSKTIGSKEYNEWLNSPLTKALKRSFEQSITDPENQPSQYGTVTLAMYEHLEEQITASQQRVAELEKENSIERNLRIGVEAGFDCANEELGRLKACVENLMLESEQWRKDCHTYCDAMHKREEAIASLQAERNALKQQRDELLAALESLLKAVERSVLPNSGQEQDAARAAIASVKEKQNDSDA